MLDSNSLKQLNYDEGEYRMQRPSNEYVPSQGCRSILFNGSFRKYRNSIAQ